MHELLTAEQMGKADALAIGSGIPGMTLMENAGRAVADVAASVAPTGPVTVVAGPGNNGGDGFVAARLLASAGRDVSVLMLGDVEALKGDAEIAKNSWHGRIEGVDHPLPEDGVIIDAIFGAGLNRAPEGFAEELVERINESKARVVAVDVPSGLNASSGKAPGACVRADATVTFFRKKPGHLLQPGRGLCGEVYLHDIGIPEMVLDSLPRDLSENTPDLWLSKLPAPRAGGHKFSRGHALVLSGPATRTGAARMSAMAALRAGAGLVTVGIPTDALAENAAHLTAVMLKEVNTPDDLAGALNDSRFSSVTLGPGFGTDPGKRDFALTALAANRTTVLDADAISLFEYAQAELFAAIRENAGEVVMTPHAGEFARLFPDLSSDGSDKVTRTRAAAELSGAVVILKGSDTVIAGPGGRAAINSNAPPWLATAGSGDVLTGIASGLVAQGMPAFEAACAAVWMHGEAGRRFGPGLIAEDLAPGLPPVLADLYRRLERA